MQHMDMGHRIVNSVAVRRLLIGLFAGGAVAVSIAFAFAGSAHATHLSSCMDEPAPSGGPAVHIGTQDSYVFLPLPGRTEYIGADLDGLSGERVDVCFRLTFPCLVCNWQGREVILVEDPNPSTLGKAVRLDDCNHDSSCSTVLNSTGAEAGIPEAVIDEPGGGTAGAGLESAALCVLINGDQIGDCSSTSLGGASVAEGDLPQAQQSGCLLDVPPAGCDIPGVIVTMGSDTLRDTVTIETPAGPVSHDVPPGCVGISGECPTTLIVLLPPGS